MQHTQPTTLGSAPPAKAAHFSDALRSLGALFANITGYIFLALAVLVLLEVLGRKLFGFSLQGVDELGGYALAVGSSLAFTTALVDRAHIRIELFHLKLPKVLQTLLNWLSIVLLAGFGVMLAWVCLTILLDTLTYQSTAPTPWATPLIYPQGVWYASLVVFAVVAVAMALHATALLLTGKASVLNRTYGPRETVEEIKDELQDLDRR
ncbi:MULTISPECIES: TRAP transporter small permease [unclassified Ensifer]|uniref:TRAP transporter small permease subunit n=1 Tax=unclassified Ensifer TaxID=2633371 RepID=UPI0009F3B002|nr:MULTISPECIES: TRAP transporter small permease [unclassified Ensifer]